MSDTEENKKATAKAMSLLLQQDRTKKELSDRLYRAGFSEYAISYALSYVEGFGYIDDYRYASNYISFHKGERSRKELRYKLQNKGVPEEILAEVFAEYVSEDEEDALRRQLIKKLRGRNLAGMEYKEKEKIMAYLARKGYAINKIKKVMSETCYESETEA